MGVTTIQFVMNRTIFHARRAHWNYSSKDAPEWSDAIGKSQIKISGNAVSLRHCQLVCLTLLLTMSGTDRVTPSQKYTSKVASRHLQTITGYTGFRNYFPFFHGSHPNCSWKSTGLFPAVIPSFRDVTYKYGQTVGIDNYTVQYLATRQLLLLAKDPTPAFRGFKTNTQV